MRYFNIIKEKYKDKPLITKIAIFDADDVIHFEKLYKDGYPFIIRNYFKLKTPLFYVNRLKKKYGKLKINGRINNTGTLDELYQQYKYHTITLSNYLLDSIQKKPQSIYLSNFNIEQFKLTDFDLQYPLNYSKNIKSFEKPKIWIGNKGSFTPLHRDSSDNFVYQIVGKKKWTIFNIQDEKYLYYLNSDDEYSYYQRLGNRKRLMRITEFAASLVDVRNPNHKRFPLFKKATPVTFNLNAGDILYIPMGFGHMVQNENFSIAVNLWQKLQRHKPAVLKK